MLEWPRNAFIPPPATPILPSRSWTIAIVRMFCAADRMLRPAEREQARSAPCRARAVRGDQLADLPGNLSCGVPQMRDTISGV